MQTSAFGPVGTLPQAVRRNFSGVSYDEAMRRIQANEKFDPTVVVKSAGLIKNFIEDYHEKLEEDHIFPRFEQSGSKLASPAYKRAAQELIAKRIIEMAQRGERNPHELAEDAVSYLDRSYA